MTQKYFNLGIIASLAPHLVCCVLPMVLAIVGIIAPVDDSVARILPHPWEPWLFVFSAVMLVISAFLVFRRCDCSCDDCTGRHKHRLSKLVLALAAVMFFVSLGLHLLMH